MRCFNPLTQIESGDSTPSTGKTVEDGVTLPLDNRIMNYYGKSMTGVKKFMAVVLTLLTNNKCQIFKVMIHVPAHKRQDYFEGPLIEVPEKQKFASCYLLVGTGATWSLRVESTWGGSIRLELTEAARLQKPSGTRKLAGAEVWHWVWKDHTKIKFFRGEELSKIGLLREVIREMDGFKSCLTGFEGPGSLIER